MTVTVEGYRKEILDGNRLATLDEHMEALEDLPDLPSWAGLYSPSIVGVGTFRVDIPFDMDTYRKLRRLLGSKWVLYKVWDTNDDHKCFEFEHFRLPVKLDVILVVALDGSTCTRVKVSEETVTRPVYEVRCE